MANDRIIITFPDVALDAGNVYAASLSDQLKDVDRAIRVDRLKQRPERWTLAQPSCSYSVRRPRPKLRRVSRNGLAGIKQRFNFLLALVL